jgi:hypothetical protein
MVLSIIIFVVVAFSTMPIFVSNLTAYSANRNNKRGRNIAILWGVFILVFGTVLIVFYPVQSNRVIDDSLEVTTVGGKTIYYDAECNDYFIVKDKIWNIFDSYERVYIDYDLGKGISENIKEYKEYASQIEGIIEDIEDERTFFE